jgi:tetratricopeptide (TPR) repeat protein
MTSPVLALILGLAAWAPAAASASWLPWDQDPVFESVQKSYDEEKFAEVADRLSGAGMRKISRRHRALAYKMLGASYTRQGRLKEAIAVYQYAEGLYPEDINILSGLANLLHHVDLDDRARPLFERVLDIHPNNAEAHLGMAEISFKQGFLEKAQRHYESVLAEWNQNEGIWRGYALVLAKRRDWAGAVQAVRRALSLLESSDSYEALAVFQRAGGDSEAYASLQRALAITEDRPDLRLRAGLWLLEDGRLDESLREAEGVLALHPEEPLALWLRASVNLRSGRMDAARKDLESAAGAGRKSPFVARAAAAMLELSRR